MSTTFDRDTSFGRRRLAFAGAVCAVLLGCAEQSSRNFSREGGLDVARTRTASDIVRVMAVYEDTPWLVRRGADRTKPVGIRISALYLISDRTGKGAFGDGVIRIFLYRVGHVPGQDSVRQEVHAWSFNSKQALPFRVAQKSWLGYGYQFDLVWPGDCDLSGSEISLVVEYERTDGKVVLSASKNCPVPG